MLTYLIVWLFTYLVSLARYCAYQMIFGTEHDRVITRPCQDID